MVDEEKILTDAEYRDGLHIAEMAKTKGWLAVRAIANSVIDLHKDTVYTETESQLRANLHRGMGMGIAELLALIDDRIIMALSRQDEENSAKERKS
jgi:hypothetical protein